MANTSPKGIRPPNQDETSPAKPAAAFRFGQVSAAAFVEKLPSGNSHVKVSLRRSYRTADGKWEHSHTLQAGDLLPAAFVLFKCAEFASGLHVSDAE